VYIESNGKLVDAVHWAQKLDDFLRQVHRVIRSNNLSSMTDIDPKRKVELSSTIFVKYKTKQ